MSLETRIETRLLRAMPLFARCSDEDLAVLAHSLDFVDVPAGTVIFREGEPGTEMYIVESGQVRVVSDVETEKVVFAHFGPGDFFGEMALMTGAPRTAGAIASTAVELWRLDKERFDLLLADHPSISAEITRTLSERLARGNEHRFQNEAVALFTLSPERSEFTIGRRTDNDLVVADPQVAAVHAKLRRVGEGWRIYDEDTETGTYVNRRRVRVADLADGDEVLIGTTKIYLDGLAVKSFVGSNGVRIDARELTRVIAGGRKILNGIEVSILPGELVAIVGGSGAGKTSLLHALNGFSPATSGDVYYNGISLYSNPDLFRTILGYLPQDDIIHQELTAERTVYYAARLRLPNDMTHAEIDARIGEVLKAVGLAEHRQTQVKRLSGGQRKRVSLAVELLGKPRALFLDEPTSGLDPALEGRMMALFRELTEDGASVIVSTHVTQNLGMCDKIIWLGRGGRLVFFGSPAEALRHFGVPHFGKIYDLLEDEAGVERWAETFVGSPAHQASVARRFEAEALGEQPLPESGRSESRLKGIATLTRQSFWLTLRHAEVLSRDAKYLTLLLIQAPLIGLALLAIFTRNIFAVSVADGGDALRATSALKVVVLVAIWLGAFDGARAISSETAIYARERLVNLGVLPYIISKVSVLSVLCLVQSSLLLAVLFARISLAGLGWQVYPALIGATFITALGGLAMGLLISAVAANSDQAMAIVPITVIPQLIFDGSFVPIEKMLAPARAVSYLAMSRWSLELTAGLTHLSARFANQLPEAFAKPFEDAFTPAAALHWSILVLFVVVPLAATLFIQKRKDAVLGAR